MAKVNPPGGKRIKDGDICGDLRQSADRRHEIRRGGVHRQLGDGVRGHPLGCRYRQRCSDAVRPIKAANRPTTTIPFGHGRELYFWTLIVAVSIFGVGGGVSIFRGVSHSWSLPRSRTRSGITQCSGHRSFSRGLPGIFGWRAFSKTRNGKPILEAIHVSKDPTSFTVILEDSTALSALAIAFFGVYFGHEFGFRLLRRCGFGPDRGPALRRGPVPRLRIEKPLDRRGCQPRDDQRHKEDRRGSAGGRKGRSRS